MEENLKRNETQLFYACLSYKRGGGGVEIGFIVYVLLS